MIASRMIVVVSSFYCPSCLCDLESLKNPSGCVIFDGVRSTHDYVNFIVSLVSVKGGGANQKEGSDRDRAVVTVTGE
jgi:hypothetical protein